MPLTQIEAAAMQVYQPTWDDRRHGRMLSQAFAPGWNPYDNGWPADWQRRPVALSYEAYCTAETALAKIRRERAHRAAPLTPRGWCSCGYCNYLREKGR